MEDSKQVVNLNVEPPPVIDRTPPAVEVQAPAEPSTEVPIAQEQSPVPAAPPAYEAVDEFGVPWKNRYMEQKRKSEEVIDRLPQMLDEKLSKVTQPQQPQPTWAQIEQYKIQNFNNPDIVKWCAEEQEKLIDKKAEDVSNKRESKYAATSKADLQRQQSLAYVQNTYPEAFQRNAQGQPVAWDEASPMTQQIRGIMQNPKFSGDPEGLAAAADMAYGRIAKGQVPVLQKKAEALKADVKQAQKASLTEGAGRRVTLSEPPQTAALNTLKKTGSLKDAENAMGALLRQRGIIGE